MTSAPVTINLFQGMNGETAIRSFSKSGSYKKGYSVGFRAGSASGYRRGIRVGSKKASSSYRRGYAKGYRNGKRVGYKSGYKVSQSPTGHNVVLKVTASCPRDSWHSSIISGTYIARGTYGGRISYENTKRDANKNWWRLIYVRNRGWKFTYSRHRVRSGRLNQIGYKSSDYVYKISQYRKSGCTFRIYPL